MFIKEQTLEVYNLVLANSTAFERIKILEGFLQKFPIKYYCFYNEILLKHFNNPVSRVTNYPKEWLETYMEKGFGEKDPAIQESIKSNKSCKWTTMNNENLVYKEALKRNIKWGCSIPIMSSNKDFTLLSIVFGSEEDLDKYYDSSLEEFEDIAFLFHVIITNSRRYYEKSPLTNKEIKVLGWLHKGKTYKDISDIEKISFSTVQSHISNIYRKLNVENKAEAIYMGIKFDLL